MDMEKKENIPPSPGNGLQDIPGTETQLAPTLSQSAEPSDVPPNSPSEEDEKTLRHVGTEIKTAVWLVAMFSGAERFAWYSLVAPLRETLIHYLVLRRAPY